MCCFPSRPTPYGHIAQPTRYLGQVECLAITKGLVMSHEFHSQTVEAPESHHQ